MLRKPCLVQDIRHTGGRYTTIHYNSEKHRVMKEATLKGYGTLWFDEGAIANIISFSRIRENYHIFYDTEGK